MVVPLIGLQKFTTQNDLVELSIVSRSLDLNQRKKFECANFICFLLQKNDEEFNYSIIEKVIEFHQKINFSTFSQKLDHF